MSCIAVDAPVPLDVLDSIRKIPGVHNVTPISIGESNDPAFR
jgi:predicted regulator of amino acid metabolism with ACT domain